MVASNVRIDIDVLPNITAVAVQPDASSRCTTQLEPSHVNSMVGSNSRTVRSVDGNRTQELPQREPPPPPAIACDPQTPVSEASAARPAQKSSNK